MPLVCASHFRHNCKKREPKLEIRIFNVEHGAAAALWSRETRKIALIDCGHNTKSGWNPSHFFQEHALTALDFLIISNADQDHYSHLNDFLQFIRPNTFIRNRKFSTEFFRKSKEQHGRLSKDAEAYLEMERTYTSPVSEPFNTSMGGISLTTFSHSENEFQDLNNLSLVCFFEFCGFTILFPGDLEPAGWNSFLNNAQFVSVLERTDILLAPHHGRTHDGLSGKIAEHLHPSAVIISDKSIEHETQVKSTPIYANYVREPGVMVENTGSYRKVLTTRSDGNIHISVGNNGSYRIITGV